MRRVRGLGAMVCIDLMRVLSAMALAWLPHTRICLAWLWLNVTKIYSKILTMRCGLARFDTVGLAARKMTGSCIKTSASPSDPRRSSRHFMYALLIPCLVPQVALELHMLDQRQSCKCRGEEALPKSARRGCAHAGCRLLKAQPFHAI